MKNIITILYLPISSTLLIYFLKDTDRRPPNKDTNMAINVHAAQIFQFQIKTIIWSLYTIMLKCPRFWNLLRQIKLRVWILLMLGSIHPYVLHVIITALYSHVCNMRTQTSIVDLYDQVSSLMDLIFAEIRFWRVCVYTVDQWKMKCHRTKSHRNCINNSRFL